MNNFILLNEQLVRKRRWKINDDEGLKKTIELGRSRTMNKRNEKKLTTLLENMLVWFLNFAHPKVSLERKIHKWNIPWNILWRPISTRPKIRTVYNNYRSTTSLIRISSEMYHIKKFRKNNNNLF